METTNNSLAGIKTKIEAVLNTKLGSRGFKTKVEMYKTALMNQETLAIYIYSSDISINNVKGQFPDLCTLRLDNDLTLEPQHFGGMGGGSLYRKIDPNNPDERHLAMKRVKVPFRRPQKTEKAVLTAIEKFAESYLEVLREIVNSGMSLRTDYVDYTTLLA